MKRYERIDVEVIVISDGDILTFSVGQLEELDPTGTQGPTVPTGGNIWNW